MRIFENLNDFSPSTTPLVLTIGNFDGMHRGHREVLKKAKTLAGAEGKTVVITFKNHPAEVLRPDQPLCYLCSLPHRLHLLEEFGIDTLILLTFTKRLAQNSAASFVEILRQTIPFTHLVLGHDATLGKDRQGDRPILIALGAKWGFSVHYVEEYRFEAKPVSSSKIRLALLQGDLPLVETLLGRPYSIYGQAKLGETGTFRLDLTGLCLPPQGEYPVDVLNEGKRYPGLAILASDLTVRVEEANFQLFDSPVEVIFQFP